ncbi:MAG: hypothetical protein KDC35_13755 [Acidobacteria bacterium]|nr:hypothetical protein [Acidobacteriota bacterium]
MRLAVRAVHGVFNRELSCATEYWTHRPLESESRDRSLAAQYAHLAVSRLTLPSKDVALLCLSGASGAFLKRFDAACGPGGGLFEQGFSERARRIHPFTLLWALQNQVPAALSIDFALKGPCLNLFESSTGLAHTYPWIQSQFGSGRTVLLVLCAAGDRDEERTKVARMRASEEGLEGAVAIHLSPEPGLGWLSTGHHPVLSPRPFREPVLAAGEALIEFVTSGISHASCTFADDVGRCLTLNWEAA